MYTHKMREARLQRLPQTIRPYSGSGVFTNRIHALVLGYGLVMVQTAVKVHTKK